MTESLLSTEWVANNLDEVRLIEVDVDIDEYEKGHISGAVGFNWTSQLQDTIRRDIATKEDFGELLSNAGVDADTHIVLYGDNNNWFAAYAFWLLKYYGHEKVSLMDGGRKKWLDESRELTTDVPSYPATGHKIATENTELRADYNFIKQRVDGDDFGMIDVRSPAEFSGEINAPPGMKETAQRSGHIPGATNVSWSQAVAEDGTFKSKEELQELYAGVAGKGDIVAYCRIGERSSHSWFALKYILGFDNVRNYDGSWTEWGNLIGVPINNPFVS